MKITHLQSSTQIIHLGDIKVLTDPWLTAGEYFGSWYHYPPFPKKDLDDLDYDYIYVSHIHPDHLSEKTFKALPKKVPVLIHRYESQFVKFKLEMFGFEVIECNHREPFVFNNGGSITIYAADNCDPELCGKFMGCAPVEVRFGSTQIDTLALFEYEGQLVLNTNDCPFELAESTIKTNNLHSMGVDVLCVGYGGAGPFPQCFEFVDIDGKEKAAKDKEEQFLKQAIEYIELVKPRAYVPFAGTYILGSRLAGLTKYRGVPTVEGALSYLSKHFKETFKGVLLSQFDVLEVEGIEKVEGNREFEKSYDEYVAEISQYELSFDKDDWDETELPGLIDNAYNRFKAKANQIEFSSNTTLIIQSDKIAFNFKVNKKPDILSETQLINEPYVKVTVDHNLLHRLLRGPRFAHWNNAEIGSHLHFDRRPNVFERGLYHCLCFMHK